MSSPISERAQKSQRRPDQHAGRWIITDSEARLLAIGDSAFPGTSPRSKADAVSRRVLLPRMRAVANGAPPSFSDASHDQKWQIFVASIRSPKTSTIVGVIGCYCAKGDPFPPMPEFGAWEAHLAASGHEQRVRIQWSDGLYRLHEMPTPTSAERADGSAALEWPEWVDSIVIPADRSNIIRGMGRSLFAATGDLSIHSVRIHSPITGGTRPLRIAVRSSRDTVTGDRWQRGIAMPLPGDPVENNDTGGVNETVNTMFAFSGDALCIIDAQIEQVTLTSPHFGDLNLALPPSRHLTEMCHSEDIPELRGYLHKALVQRDRNKSVTWQHTSPVPVRLRGRDGTWKIFGIMAVPLPVAPRQVMCRVLDH